MVIHIPIFCHEIHDLVMFLHISILKVTERTLSKVESTDLLIKQTQVSFFALVIAWSSSRTMGKLMPSQVVLYHMVTYNRTLPKELLTLSHGYIQQNVTQRTIKTNMKVFGKYLDCLVQRNSSSKGIPWNRFYKVEQIRTHTHTHHTCKHQ